MPEIQGVAALYCGPDKPTAWVAAILQLAADGRLRSEFIARGIAQAAKYQWRMSAIRLLELVRPMVKRGD
jgi:glycosyltransferase involved in cell wall biosynthesis